MSLFEEELDVKETTSKAKKSAARKQVDFNEEDALGNNLFDLCGALTQLSRALYKESKILEESVKSKILDEFTDIAINEKRKPESFEGNGSASKSLCQMRNRGKNIPIDPQVAKELASIGISLSKEETVKIKDEVIQDKEKQTKIINALKSAGLNLKDYLDMTNRYYCSENTIADIARKVDDKSKVREYLEKVSFIVMGTSHFAGDPLLAKQKVLDIVNRVGSLTTDSDPDE